MRILRIILLYSGIFLASGLQAQERKALTLEEAVLKQSTDLAPKSISGLEWLNISAYIWKDGKGEKENYLYYDLQRKREGILVTLPEFREKMKAKGIDVNELPNFRRIADNQLQFQVKSIHYRYDVSKGSIESFENETDGVSDVILSPNGEYLAYVKANNIYIKPVNAPVRQITTDGSENLINGKAASRFEFGISAGLFWSPDSKALAYYRIDQSEVSTYPLADYNTTPASHSPLKYPMAGSKSEKVSLHIYFLDGKKVVIQTDPSPDKETYICSVNWIPDGKSMHLVTLNRGQDHMKIQRYSTLSGNLSSVEYEEKDEKYVEPLHPLIYLNKEGSDYLFLSRKDGYTQPYQISAGQVKRHAMGKTEISKYVGINENQGSLYFEGSGEKATETDIYKLDLGKEQYHKISGQSGTYHATLSPGGNYMISYFSNISTPSKVVVADKNGLVIRQLLDAPDPLEGFKLARPELVTLDNGYGTMLHGRIVKPHDFDKNKKYPVLIYVYNGPHVQLVKNSWWAAAPLWMSYFAERGFIVFTVDGRGSEGRGKDFEQAIFRNLGEVEMSDQLAGVNYLKSLPYVDGDKMAIHGWSYGGFMTTSLMLRQPGVFRVGVAGGPVTNWALYEVMYTERYMDTPETNPDGYKKSDLSNYANNLKGKLLLIHGMNDDTVVPQHNLILVKKFIDAGIDIDFFPYPGHAHNVRGKDRLHLMTKVLSYIEGNIGL